MLAFAERGGFLHAPDTYMEKIAVGGGLPAGVVGLDRTPADNLARLAAARGGKVAELTVTILDRPRHRGLIAAVREAGARIRLIRDGDVAGVIATARPETGTDLYMGTGGAPEGVLAAAALRCIGGQFQGRLAFRNDEEKARARAMGIADAAAIYDAEALAGGRCRLRGHRRHRWLDAEGRASRRRRARHPVHRHALGERHGARRLRLARPGAQELRRDGLRRARCRARRRRRPPFWGWNDRWAGGAGWAA